MTVLGKITFKVNEKQLDKDVKMAILKHLNSKLLVVADMSGKRIQELFSKLILESDTIKALGGGQLQWEFGFTDIEVRIEDILKQWTSTMQIKHKPLRLTARGLSGGFTISMVKSDWSDVVNRELAIFITDEHKYHLRWLEWLLTEGGKAVVAEYDFIGKGGLGRLGHGLMIKNTRRKRWSVPSAFQGTTNHNFVTEVIDKIHDMLPIIFTEEFNKVL